MRSKVHGTAQPTKKWDKADKINGAGVLIALIGLILGVGVPDLLHGIAYLRRPQASFSWPNNNANMPNNTFGASGKAKNIPSDSDLWLVVTSVTGGRWYPNGYLDIVNGLWHVPANEICPSSGPQELMIYEVPDSEQASLYSYVTSKAASEGLGINSMPLGATVLATRNVYVPADRNPSC
jgi:hypothetical protein